MTGYHLQRFKRKCPCCKKYVNVVVVHRGYDHKRATRDYRAYIHKTNADRKRERRQESHKE